MKTLSLALDEASYARIKAAADRASQDMTTWIERAAIEAADRAAADRSRTTEDEAAILRRGADAVSDPAWKARFRRAADAANRDRTDPPPGRNPPQ